MAVTETLEVERKFDVGGSDELPVFTSIAGVDRVGTAGEHKLHAVYFDTATLALAARRITLRRRTGGKDAGWHLKVPVAAGERREITEPLNEDPDSVPARLKELVLVHTRNQELVAVAELKTRRTAIPLIAADGTVLAEFSDDRVESRILLEPAESAAWREWEIDCRRLSPDLPELPPIPSARRQCRAGASWRPCRGTARAGVEWRQTSMAAVRSNRARAR